MKTLFLISILLFNLGTGKCQNEVFKKMICEDLISVNDMYNKELIQKKQFLKTKSGSGDSSSLVQTWEDIKDSYNYASIVQVNRYLEFYFITVKFDLESSTLGMFDSSFSYIVAFDGNRYVKINGFFLSEIMSLKTFDYMESPFFNRKLFFGEEGGRKFHKYLLKNNTEKVRLFLSCSILKRLSEVKYKTVYFPYVIDYYGIL